LFVAKNRDLYESNTEFIMLTLDLVLTYILQLQT